MLLAGCGQSVAPRPDLPESVSPGWKLSSFDRSAPPAGVSADGEPQCWKADYAGPGSAQVWACGYRASGSAFDAEQRARAEADTVKFQEGKYLVIVNWHGGSRTEVTALIRGLQKALQVK